jgi:oligoendopeptidase F
MQPSTEFVPHPFDATAWENIEPLMQALIARPVSTKADLERWLLDRSELDAACSESQATLYINMTCDTDDQAAQQAYVRFIEHVAPKIKPLSFELDRRLVELEKAVGGLDAGRYGVLLRGTRTEVELFREENVALQTDLAKLGQRFEQISGAMTVQFEGREQTLPMMSRYQENTDRALRESAWRAVADRRLQNADEMEDIYDQMIALRDQISRNAGHANFVGYAFKEKHRFDYGPEHCRAFHDACEKVVMPLIRDLDRRRAASLKIDQLRPWDLSVDVKGRAPLRPFEGGRELVSKCLDTFDRLDPRLSAMLKTMGDGSEKRGCREGASLDLDSRKGKAPGGYQYNRDRVRKPFIFMNAAGLQRDVVTMLHEAGHAFHSMLAAHDPMVTYRHSPIEFAEVASMSMELLTLPHWGPAAGRDPICKDEETLARATRQQLERSVTILPWIATIDAFQHWAYSNPKHTRDERAAFWISLDERFGNAVSWDGIESVRRRLWQRQLHLYTHAFYYIEYGIAQIGALGLWLLGQEKGEKAAVEHYIKGLSLGGAKPLPELFKAAGLPFDFGPEIVKRIADRVAKELDKLPE